MSQLIVWTNELGGMSVCVPTGELSVEQTAAKDAPAQAVIIERESLPEDTDFFDAFVLNEKTVTVDLEKAKEVTRKRLRVERAPLLEAQDVAFQRALETGTDTSAIVAEKQRLRDITTLSNSCTDLEQLRNLKARA
jgi:hypothetical protein